MQKCFPTVVHGAALSAGGCSKLVLPWEEQMSGREVLAFVALHRCTALFISPGPAATLQETQQ